MSPIKCWVLFSMTHTTLKLSLYSRIFWPSKFFHVFNISVFSGKNDLTMKKCAFTIHSFQCHTHSEISYLLNVESKKIIFRHTHTHTVHYFVHLESKILNHKYIFGTEYGWKQVQHSTYYTFFLHLQTSLIHKNTVMIPAKWCYIVCARHWYHVTLINLKT